MHEVCIAHSTYCVQYSGKRQHFLVGFFHYCCCLLVVYVNLHILFALIIARILSECTLYTPFSFVTLNLVLIGIFCFLSFYRSLPMRHNANYDIFSKSENMLQNTKSIWLNFFLQPLFTQDTFFILNDSR